MNQILERLKQYRNEPRALRDQQYHKSKREHWGVSAPECNQLVRFFSKERTAQDVLKDAQDLWNTDLFDPMIFAAKLLSAIPPSEELWKTIVSFLRQVDGWALEDTLAHAAWKCILADESRLDLLEEWTKHPNFWMRRASLIYTLPFAKPNRNPERSLKWASLYAPDAEWFIQKAIGWWLRVLGEHNPERVMIFLQKHWTELKGVARKEATRKLKENYQHRFPKQMLFSPG